MLTLPEDLDAWQSVCLLGQRQAQRPRLAVWRAQRASRRKLLLMITGNKALQRFQCSSAAPNYGEMLCGQRRVVPMSSPTYLPQPGCDFFVDGNISLLFLFYLFFPKTRLLSSTAGKTIFFLHWFQCEEDPTCPYQKQCPSLGCLKTRNPLHL